MRCFISIEIPEEIKREILKIQEQLPKFDGKIIEEENLHLTLKFLGDISEDKIIKVNKKLKEINFQKFNAEIDSIGFFSEKEIRIIWLNIKNCEKLQKEIDSKLKNLFEMEKNFIGHLTIARVKFVENRKKFLDELKKINFSHLNFLVDKFSLRKSILTEKGPIYEDISIYNLKI